MSSGSGSGRRRFVGNRLRKVRLQLPQGTALVPLPCETKEDDCETKCPPVVTEGPCTAEDLTPEDCEYFDGTVPKDWRMYAGLLAVNGPQIFLSYIGSCTWSGEFDTLSNGDGTAVIGYDVDLDSWYLFLSAIYSDGSTASAIYYPEAVDGMDAWTPYAGGAWVRDDAATEGELLPGSQPSYFVWPMKPDCVQGGGSGSGSGDPLNPGGASCTDIDPDDVPTVLYLSFSNLPACVADCPDMLATWTLERGGAYSWKIGDWNNPEGLQCNEDGGGNTFDFSCQSGHWRYSYATTFTNDGADPCTDCGPGVFGDIVHPDGWSASPITWRFQVPACLYKGCVGGGCITATISETPP